VSAWLGLCEPDGSLTDLAFGCSAMTGRRVASRTRSASSAVSLTVARAGPQPVLIAFCEEELAVHP
jgi:hypothetical protein